MALEPTAAKQQERPLLDVGGPMLQLNSDNGWTNKLNELKAEAARLPRCSILMHPRMKADEAIAAAEAFDKQTDMLLRDVIPPTEMIKTKAVKKASELSAQERIDTLDALLSYFTQFCRGTTCNICVETCFYLHEASYAEGDPIGEFTQSLLVLMMQVTNIIDLGNVRDGDEEFGPQFIGRTRMPRSSIDLEALDAEVKKGDAAAKRFAVLAALARYAAAALDIAKKGALDSHGQLRAAVDALAAAVDGLEPARPTGEAVVPPPAAFTPQGALWDSMSIPHQSVPPCAWSEAMGYFRQLAADTRVLYEEWLPLSSDLLNVLEAAKAYCHRDPAPGLVARSVASVFVMHGQQPFGGDSILMLLLALLRDRFGAPWFHTLIRPQSEDDHKNLQSLVEHTLRCHNADARAPNQQALLDDTKRTMVLSLSSAVMEIGHLICRLITIYLRNRGRCHRSLVNLLPSLVQCQSQLWRLEHTSFIIAAQPAAKTYERQINRNEVLHNVMMDVVIDTCQQICVLTQRLGLLTFAELPALEVYYQHFASVRAEVAHALYPTESLISEFREAASRRGVPPALGLRQARPVPPSVMASIETAMAFTRGAAWALNVHKAKLPELKQPEGALQSLQNVFNHRFRPLQTTVLRPPLMSYQEIQDFTKMPEPERFIKQSVDQFKAVVARIPAIRALVTDATHLRMLDAAEKAAKKNSVVVGLLKNEGFTGKIEIDNEFPWIITLNAVKA
jgi:hypothetical protein